MVTVVVTVVFVVVITLPSPLQIAARPGAQHLRCLYRVTFVPRDAYDLLRKDSMAFEYLYLQVNPLPALGFTPPLAKPRTPLLTHRSPLSLPSRLFSNCPASVPEVWWGVAMSQSPGLGLAGPRRDGGAHSVPRLGDICRPFAGVPAVLSPSPAACFTFVWSRAVIKSIRPSQVLVTGTSLNQVLHTGTSFPFRPYAGPVQYLYPSAARELALFRKPTWRGLAKWLWNYRKLLQLLYQLRFLLYLLARLKSLGKWALGLKVMAVLIKNLEMVKKHLRKLGAVGAALMRRKLVRRVLRQVRRFMRRYLALGVLWRLVKRLMRK